jgi:hypothetical protein
MDWIPYIGSVAMAPTRAFTPDDPVAFKDALADLLARYRAMKIARER